MLSVMKWSVIALAAGFTAIAQADEGLEFEGIYFGQLDLSESGGKAVDLQLSLALTGETVTRPGGEVEQVIDGAFVLDQEGGAYTFTKVSFDINEAKIDMKYLRQELTSNPETPASFRLVGYFQSDNSIEGRVFSGTRGPIGTFKVTHGGVPAFRRQSKYTGRWEGFADLRAGGRVPMSIELVDTEGSTTNPVNMEFAFTPGKLASIHWGAINFSMSNIVIDYLRGVISMRRGGETGPTELSIEYVVDESSRNAIGVVKSAGRGEVARFQLPPIQN
jgi:hypothetical protein